MLGKAQTEILTARNLTSTVGVQGCQRLVSAEAQPMDLRWFARLEAPVARQRARHGSGVRHGNVVLKRLAGGCAWWAGRDARGRQSPPCPLRNRRELSSTRAMHGGESERPCSRVADSPSSSVWGAVQLPFQTGECGIGLQQQSCLQLQADSLVIDHVLAEGIPQKEQIPRVKYLQRPSRHTRHKAVSLGGSLTLRCESTRECIASGRLGFNWLNPTATATGTISTRSKKLPGPPRLSEMRCLGPPQPARRATTIMGTRTTCGEPR